MLNTPTQNETVERKPELRCTLTLINGNGRPYQLGLHKLYILGTFNDTALEHIRKNTGLSFEKKTGGMEAQPENGNQITALLMTYNFKTRYYNNGSVENTIFLKSDHHHGFDVDSICRDCARHNHIFTNITEVSRLAC